MEIKEVIKKRAINPLSLFGSSQGTIEASCVKSNTEAPVD
jgi:hypothetical protein